MLRLAFTVLLVSISAIDARAQRPRELLATARAENRKTVASIHSFSCRFRIWNQPVNQATALAQWGEFWASGSSVRVKWNTADRTGEILVSGGQVFSFSFEQGKQRPAGGAIAAYDGTPVGECDPRYFSLFHLASKPGERSTPAVFDDIVGKRRILHAASNEDHITLELESAGASDSRSRFQFDRKKNYLISELSTDARIGNRNLSARRRITSWREPAPGVFFPTSVVSETHEGGTLTQSQTCEFSDIVVNQVIPAQVFVLKFPAKCEVHDLIRGKKYVVDATGSPAGPETTLNTIPPPPRGENAARETREEPKSWTRWILPASLMCLLVSLAAWGFNRWRAARRNE